MADPKPFRIDLGDLKAREKDQSPGTIERIDQTGDDLGFVAREGGKRRGRRPSPRTGQVHAKVMPHVSDEIAAEARRRGVQQGVILEEAWVLYKQKSGI